jgi:hypothetical protein
MYLSIDIHPDQPIERAVGVHLIKLATDRLIPLIRDGVTQAKFEIDYATGAGATARDGKAAVGYAVTGL